METNWKQGAFGALRPAEAVPLGGRFGHGFQAVRQKGEGPIVVSCGDLVLDRATRRAAIAGADLRLTEREYDLLLCLADRANRVVRRSDLLAQVWPLEDDDGSNLLAVYIGRLRQKFGNHAAMIKTVRGIGYRLRPLEPT